MLIHISLPNLSTNPINSAALQLDRSDFTPNSLFANPILIMADHHITGVEAEYRYLSKRFGRRGRDWQLLSQKLFYFERSYFDQLLIALTTGEERTITFDITDFYNKPAS